MGPVGAEKMPGHLTAEFMIGGVASPAGDQSQVFPAPLELMLRQVLFPIADLLR